MVKDFEEANSLTYIGAVFKETQRLQPVAPVNSLSCKVIGPAQRGDGSTGASFSKDSLSNADASSSGELGWCSYVVRGNRLPASFLAGAHGSEVFGFSSDS